MGILTTTQVAQADEVTLTRVTGTLAIKDDGVTSSKILNNTIVDADISNSAAISASKINGAVGTLIETITVSGADATTVTSATISPVYSYYRVCGTYATDASGSDVIIKMRFNSDTTAANYQWQSLTAGNGASAATQAATDTNGIAVGFARDGGSTTFGFLDCHIQNIATGTRKGVVSTGGNGSAIGVNNGSWLNTSAQINVIQLNINGTLKFKVGTTFTIYGSNNPF